MVVPDPQALIDDLRKRGLDASRATSSIAVVEPQAEDSPPTRARRMMSGVVFVPAYPGLPPHGFDVMADLVNGCTAVDAVEEVALS